MTALDPAVSDAVHKEVETWLQSSAMKKVQRAIAKEVEELKGEAFKIAVAKLGTATASCQKVSKGPGSESWKSGLEDAPLQKLQHRTQMSILTNNFAAPRLCGKSSLP